MAGPCVRSRTSALLDSAVVCSIERSAGTTLVDTNIRIGTNAFPMYNMSQADGFYNHQVSNVIFAHNLSMGKDAGRILEEQFGVQYTLDGAYDLLHRLGFSCLTPRPKHRKNDLQPMQQWLDDAPFCPACTPAVPRETG